MMKTDPILRKEILAFIQGGQAHMGLKALDDFPPEHYNTFAPNIEYSFWHLLEHIRLAQRDILDFMQDPNYRARQWPQDYWPPKAAICTPQAWVDTCEEIRNDLSSVESLVKDDRVDLNSEIPNHPGYSYLREILLIADHNAYHLGELSILRQVMSLW